MGLRRSLHVKAERSWTPPPVGDVFADDDGDNDDGDNDGGGDADAGTAAAPADPAQAGD